MDEHKICGWEDQYDQCGEFEWKVVQMRRKKIDSYNVKVWIGFLGTLSKKFTGLFGNFSQYRVGGGIPKSFLYYK